MRPRYGAALLALAPLCFTTSQATAVETPRPAFVNIVIESPVQRDAPPRWRVESVTRGLDGGVLTPEVTCHQESPQIEPGQPLPWFAVTCVPVRPPGPVGPGEVVTSREWRCQNPAVQATIAGPVPNEQVSGMVTCGQPPVAGAACTAAATTPAVLQGGWSGDCFQNTVTTGPLPIRCWVDLSRVFLDRWTVTCWGTDP